MLGIWRLQEGVPVLLISYGDNVRDPFDLETVLRGLNPGEEACVGSGVRPKVGGTQVLLRLGKGRL